MSQYGDTEGSAAEPSGHLDSEEVEAALDSLSAGDKQKLLMIERAYRRGTDMPPKELLHEAMCSVILGDRQWPRDVAPVPFLIMTMSSVASHARAKRFREMAVGDVADLMTVAAADPVFAGQLPTPEEVLLLRDEKQTIDEILSCFENDQEAELVLLGWLGDLRGKELRDYVGVDQATLDYAIKRIRRVMLKRYPDRWKK